MNRLLTVVDDGARAAVSIGTATDVLEVLRRLRFALDAPCGGAGTCGKCTVRVLAGEAAAADAVERSLLAPARLAAGVRLACRLAPSAHLVVELPPGRARAQRPDPPAAGPDGPGRGEPGRDPPLRRRRVTLPPATLTDAAPDLERLLRHAGCAGHRLSLAALQELSATLRRCDQSVDVIEAMAPSGTVGNVLLAVEAPVADAGLWGVAVDIGTTTVAAYLVDLATGRVVDVHAEPNRQADLGADVVTRLAHARQHGVGELQRRIVEQLQALVALLSARHASTPTAVRALTVVGNTTMLHALLGLDPSAIAVAPFVPVTVAARVYEARELGLSLHRAASVETLPGVSAYVGADVVAAVLAAGMDEARGISLLIDLGTNGEVVLGNASWLLACSAAAGPAFEGACIGAGVGGVEGAVSAFALTPGDQVPSPSTIGGVPAVGICGAGLLDVVAALLDAGVIDEGGRLRRRDELAPSVAAAVRERCVEQRGRAAFVVVPGPETEGGEAIVLNECDVRELQLAKAAVAAAIDTLLGAAGIAADEVERVYLAGGFGSFLRADAAARVGLLPTVLSARSEALGNAAGSGVVMAATSLARRERAAAIAARMRTLELSGSPAFADAFVAHLGFEPAAVG